MMEFVMVPLMMRFVKVAEELAAAAVVRGIERPGRSGCGKTTLTRLINGLIPHFFPGDLTGTVPVNGKDVREVPTYDLAEMVGSVFQDPRSQFFTTNTISVQR